MAVNVNFFGLQRTLAKTDSIQVPISKKTQKVADLFAYIKERFPEISLNKGMVMVTVNNQLSTMEQDLISNDDISFIPPIGGG